MGFLAEHFHVEFDPGLFQRQGYLSGSDDRRLEELNRALESTEVRAVVAARGGYGLSRIVDRVDWRAFQKNPKWIVGFSDITVLHAKAWELGVASLHAHNVAGLGRGDAKGRSSWVESLRAPEAPRSLQGKSTWVGGSARGILVGGNLTMLFTSAAAGKLWLPPGCVLALEDVGESSYRIDRMLTALLSGGKLAEVAALALGEFVDCSSGTYSVSVDAVLEERLSGLGIPTLAGLPFGHGRFNQPLPLGTLTELDADRKVLLLGR
jgi:muramoyltetrapeptide carboxypeptidase